MSVIPLPKAPAHKPALLEGAGLGFSLSGIKRDLFTKDVAGMLHGLRRLLQVAWHYKDHRRLLKVLDAAHTQAIFRQVPRTAYRYTLPYLSDNFDRATRLELLISHYGFMNQQLGAAFCDGVVKGNLELWSSDQPDHHFSIQVSGPCAASGHREGELTFTLRMNGAALHKLSFSIVSTRLLSLPSGSISAGHEHTIYIGRVQGVAGTFEETREATKACHDIAPPDLLMAALSGMATALGIESIAGVSIEHSISSELIQESNTSFDYTAFWDRYHGQKTGNGHHLMAVPFPEKPIQAIAAKHRKRTLIKRGFKHEINQAARACVSRMTSGL